MCQFQVSGWTRRFAQVATSAFIAVIAMTALAAPTLSLVSDDPALNHPHAIATDGVHIYFSTGTEPTTLSRIPINGGAVEALYTQVHTGIEGIAVIGDTLYWNNMNMGAATANATFSAPKDGSGPVTLLRDGGDYGNTPGDATGLVTDGSKLYLADGWGGRTYSMNLDGTGFSQIGTNRWNVAMGEYIGGVSILHKNGTLYFANMTKPGYFSGGVFSLPATGGSYTTLATSDIFTTNSYFRLAEANDVIYLAQENANTLWQMPISGGNPTAFFSGAPLNVLMGICTNGNTMYIADGGTGSSTGAIWKLDLNANTLDNKIDTVQYSKDGSMILVSGLSPKIKLWQGQTGRFIKDVLVPFNDREIRASFMNDAQSLASCQVIVENQVRFWEVATGLLTQTITAAGQSNSLEFSPNGSSLAFICHDASSTCYFYDLPSNNPTGSIHSSGGYFYCSTFSPDSSKIVLGTSLHTARMFNVSTKALIYEFNSAESSSDGAILGAAFSPDGAILAICGGNNGDPTLSLWNVATGEKIRSFSGHTMGVTDIKFTPDGKKIITSSDDMTARLWDVATGNCLHVFTGHTAIVRRLDVSPDGKRMVTGSHDKTARIWDLETGEQLCILGEGEITPTPTPTPTISPTPSPTPTPAEPTLEILSVAQAAEKKISIQYRLTPHDPAPAGGYDLTVLAKATVQNCQDTASDPDTLFDDITAYSTGDLHIAPAGGEGTLLWDVRGMPQGALRDKYYRANVSVLFRLRAAPVHQ